MWIIERLARVNRLNNWESRWLTFYAIADLSYIPRPVKDMIKQQKKIEGRKFRLYNIETKEVIPV